MAFADHGTLEGVLEPNYAAAERVIAAIAAEGLDVDALGEFLQHQGTKSFVADWAALLEAISARVTRMQSHNDQSDQQRQ